MMALDLQPEAIIPELSATTKDDLLAELSANVVSRCPELSEAEIVRVLQERELLGSTGIGDGVAIPHGKLREMNRDPVLAFGRSREGIDFNALDGRKAHLFFLLLASDSAVGLHLKVLARISRILKDPVVRRSLLEALDAAAIHAIITEQERIS
jgi:PTS system nitrogen regulatory IIA component